MKCYYCDFECEEKDLIKHLNARHEHCAFCGEVFDDEQHDKHFELCEKTKEAMKEKIR
jgi:hypothetical protein